MNFMYSFKPDAKTIYRKKCTNCKNENPDKFVILDIKVVKCLNCGAVYDGVAEKAERMVYESQRKS